MAKKSDAVFQLSRKGLFIWATLILFIACWMFVLGILVGRGQAPVNLNAGMLEKELETIKADKAKKEQAKVDAHTGVDGEDKPELGFYKALKEGRGRQPMKRPPKKQVKPKKKLAMTKPPAPRKKVANPASKPTKAKRPSTKQQTQAATPVKPAPSKGHFTIQVAAVKVMANAEKLVGDLRKKGYPAYQVGVTVPGKGPWYRVRVGAYDNRGAADQMLKKLTADKVKGMVVSTK